MRLMQDPEPVFSFHEYDPAVIAHKVVDVVYDKKGTDVVLLDIRRLTTFADYFVITSGTSKVQIRALAENVEEALDGANVRPLHREGSAEDGWILIDYGQVVVHIFSPERREFYGLEKLWSGATTVVRMQ